MTDALVEAPIAFEDFYEQAKKVIAPRRSKFGRVPFADIFKPGPEHAFIIDGFLSVGGVSIIAGPQQSGKSFLAIHAGMCIARGRPFFGHDIENPGLVIYQAGEGQLGVFKRLRAYSLHEGLDPVTKLPFEFLTKRVDLFRPDADTNGLIDEIKQISEDWPLLTPTVLFIDTIAAATSGADENSFKDVSTILDNVQRIATDCKIHVCLVAHTPAAGGKVRGHTAVTNNIDQVILVEHNKETGVRVAKLDKQKDEEAGKPFRFELMRVELGTTPKGKLITSCVCVPLGEKAAEAEARSLNWMRLGPTFHTAMLALVAAVKKTGRRPPDQIDFPAWADAVTLSDWRNEYAKLKAGEEEDPEKLKERTKKARDRATDKFLANHLIGKSGDWVWRTKRKIFGIDYAPNEPKITELPADLIDSLGDDPVF